MFSVCSLTKAQVADLCDWNKDALSERYLQIKDAVSVCVTAGHPLDLKKHRLARAKLTPPKELLDYVYHDCFEVNGTRMNLPQLQEYMSQVC